MAWPRWVAAAACLVCAACAAGGSDARSPATVPSSTVPATMAPSTAQEIADPGRGLLDGALMEAWNDHDMDAYWSFFVDEPTWLGIIDPDRREAYAESWHVFGWRYGSQDCVEAPAYADCRMVFVDDFHTPAGSTFVGTEQFWFDDQGLITAYAVAGSDRRYAAHSAAFDSWLVEAHPDLAVDFVDVDPHERSPAAWARVLAVVPEFLDQSDEYPLDEDPVVPEPVLAGTVDGVDVFNADAEQLALVEWAFDRFEVAGLPLPPITHITFPPSMACARGNTGVARHDGAEGSIDVCIASEQSGDRGSQTLSARRCILHELGHIWMIGHLDDARRVAFLSQRHLGEWNSSSWEASGSEHAAEVLMWGLMDEPVVARVTPNTCEGLSSAYRTLTGTTASLRADDCVDMARTDRGAVSVPPSPP